MAVVMGSDYEEAMERARKYAQPNPKNMWAKSADPEARAKAAKQADRRRATSEMRTKNVQRESVWQKIRGK